MALAATKKKRPLPSAYIIARAETAAGKPSFRDALRHRKYLVPAGGFHDWQMLVQARQPYYFTAATGSPLVFAGLWDRWEGPNGVVEGVAVLTVPANDPIRPLHDRMPAVMPPEDFATWLDPTVRDPATLLPLLRAYPADRMRRWPVDRWVNSVRDEEPGLTAAVALPDRAVQPSLFDAA
jgi:putative SOS response-associated peptidase YedK